MQLDLSLLPPYSPAPSASPLWAAGLVCSTNVREKTFCRFNHSARNSVMKSEMTSEFSRDQALRGFFTNPLLANPFSHIPGEKKYIYISNLNIIKFEYNILIGAFLFISSCTSSLCNSPREKKGVGREKKRSVYVYLYVIQHHLHFRVL